jgi:HK97 family phage major capsid protein
MAITNPTTTSNFAGYLKPDMAQPYFDEAAKQSAVQSQARKVPLGANGESVPIVTSKPKAGWVAQGGEKPKTEGSLGLLEMQPKKIAAIAVVSAEVVRANPGNYMNLLRSEIAEAFAVAFDAAVLHGTDSPFDHYLAETTHEVELGTAAQTAGGLYADLNAGLSLLVNQTPKRKLTGFLFDTAFEADLNGAVDVNGRPLFIDAPYEGTSLQSGKLLRRPTVLADTVGASSVVGYGGDWSKVVWGAVGGITYDVSTQATVTINSQLVSLWEHNLVAIRAEAEYGVLIADLDAFAKYVRPEPEPEPEP